MVALAEPITGVVSGQALRARNDYNYAIMAVRSIAESSGTGVSSARSLLEDARVALSWDNWDVASTLSLDAVDLANKQVFRKVWEPRFEAVRIAFLDAIEEVESKYPSHDDLSEFQNRFRDIYRDFANLEPDRGQSNCTARRLVDELSDITLSIIQRGHDLKRNRVPERSSKPIDRSRDRVKRQGSHGPGRYSRRR